MDSPYLASLDAIMSDMNLATLRDCDKGCQCHILPAVSWCFWQWLLVKAGSGRKFRSEVLVYGVYCLTLILAYTRAFMLSLSNNSPQQGDEQVSSACSSYAHSRHILDASEHGWNWGRVASTSSTCDCLLNIPAFRL